MSLLQGHQLQPMGLAQPKADVTAPVASPHKPGTLGQRKQLYHPVQKQCYHGAGGILCGVVGLVEMYRQTQTKVSLQKTHNKA